MDTAFAAVSRAVEETENAQAQFRRACSIMANAALNGAAIGAALGQEFGPALWDETQAAALALSHAEAAPGFDWGSAPMDWESVCARIGLEVLAGASGDWPAFVRSILKPAPVKLSPKFLPGDRVELVEQVEGNRACRNGVVVLYRGKMDTKQPRVRWASGWGTSVPVAALRYQTQKEMARPLPAVIPGDLI